jgi:hypothetical protein
MRLKFKKSIIRQFRSHDQFISYKYNHEIEILKSIIRQFRSHDQSVNLLINIIVSFDLIKKENFDLMIDNLTPEKVEFRSHEIRPHDR